MDNDSSERFWRQLRKTLWSPQVFVFLLTAIPPAIAYVFLAGHFVTEPGSSAEHWPLPFAAGLYVLAIVAAFVTLIMAGAFVLTGYALAPIAPKDGVKAFERWRVVWFCALGGGTIGFFVIAFASHRFAHRTIPLGSFLLVPVGAAMATVLVAAEGGSFIATLRKLGFRISSSAVNWILCTVYIVGYTNGIVRHQHWNWNTSFAAWEFLTLFLGWATIASLLAAHRKYATAWTSAAFAFAWIAILDPTDVFAMPFVYLHW